MNKNPPPADPLEREATAQPLLACTVCRKQVPKSEALSEEARDYVYYFCGRDCYWKWKSEADARYRSGYSGD